MAVGNASSESYHVYGIWPESASACHDTSIRKHPIIESLQIDYHLTNFDMI